MRVGPAQQHFFTSCSLEAIFCRQLSYRESYDDVQRLLLRGRQAWSCTSSGLDRIGSRSRSWRRASPLNGAQPLRLQALRITTWHRAESLLFPNAVREVCDAQLLARGGTRTSRDLPSRFPGLLRFDGGVLGLPDTATRAIAAAIENEPKPDAGLARVPGLRRQHRIVPARQPSDGRRSHPRFDFAQLP